MAEPTIIVGIAKTPTGYVVMDQLQREHHAVNEQILGAIVASLCTDEEIPKAERIAPNAEKIRTAAVKVARKLLPEYGEVAEPIIDGLTGFARFVHAKVTAPAPPKARGPRTARRKPTPKPTPKVAAREDTR